MIYIGIDDTDVVGSRGTGHLAQLIADDLSSNFLVLGVTRHQLLFDPRVPYTAKNSCAAIHLAMVTINLPVLFNRIKAIMLANFEEGSDPGLAVAGFVPQHIIDFGKKAKNEIVSKKDAFSLASQCPVLIGGLGGTNDGVIGAMAALGLAASGDDGRYIRVGAVRGLEGPITPQQAVDAGIVAVKQQNGKDVTDGLILAEKLRPSRREGKPILFVEQGNQYWHPLKLD